MNQALHILMPGLMTTIQNLGRTGGYPKIATVISADLPEIGRLSIGSKIAFEAVTVETAQALRRDMLSYLDSLRDYIVPVGRTSADVAPRLLDHNLISGVVDALLDHAADH